MALMRLCSVKKQGMTISHENMIKQQKVIAKKSRSQKTIQENKADSQTYNQDISVPKDLSSLNDKDAKLEIISKITVEPPKLIGRGWFGSASYYVYPITTVINEQTFKVNRRFSDLDWMHNRFVAKYKGFLIPPRPDKRFIHNSDDRFIEERRDQIEKYLNITLNSQILSESPTFRVFTQIDDENFEVEKKKLEDLQLTSENKSFEDVIDNLYVKVIASYDILFKNSSSKISEEMEDLEVKLNELDLSSSNFIVSFTDWLQRMKDREDLFELFEIPENEVISGLFKMHSKLALGLLGNLDTVKSEFQKDYMKIEGLEHAFLTYKSSISQCHEQETLISRKYEKHKNSHNEETAVRYMKELQQEQENLEKLKVSISDIENNLIDENTRLQESRNTNMIENFLQLANLQAEFYSKETDYWEKALRSI